MKSVKLNFTIDFVSNLPSLSRTGRIISEKTSIETPCCLMTTKGASIPHLSKEVLGYLLKDQIDKQIFQISLSNTSHMEEALKSIGCGIATFAGFPDQLTYLSLNDPCEVTPSNFNEKNTVPLFTRRGKEVLTSEKYMTLVRSMLPSMYQTLCDSDTNNESSKKRIEKSVTRSNEFFKDCIELHKSTKELSNSLIVAPIVGGFNKNARETSIKEINAYIECIFGYSFEGLHNNGVSALKIPIDALRDIVHHCVKQIKNDKLRIAHGAYHPLAILELVNLGIDIFDTSYVYLATQNHKALCFEVDASSAETDSDFYLDLSNEKHKAEFIPICSFCKCLACEKHTRAYIHHLINTKELLGPILLMIHNLHHYLQFFDSIRRAIKNNELSKLTQLIKKQSADDYEAILILNKDLEKNKFKNTT